MSFSKIFGALVLASFVVGCASPLSDSQKAEFKEMNKDLNSVVGKGSGRAATAFGALAVATERNAELEAKMADKLKDCNVQQPAPNDKNITVKVDGPNCGISIDMSVNQSADGNPVDAKFKIAFEIKDADLLALSDVSKMDLSGYMKLTDSVADAKITGYLTSKKHGRVDVNMTVNGSAQTGGVFSIRYKAKSFDVNVEMKQDSGGKVTLSINGKSATAQEINDLFNNDGMIPGTSIKAPESNSTASLVEFNS